MEKKKIHIRLKAPANHKRYYCRQDESSRVAFAFDSDDIKIGSLLIATSPDFSNIIHSSPCPSVNCPVDIPPGEYSWKIQGDDVESETRHLNIISRKNIHFFLPRAGDLVTGNNIHIAVRKIENAAQYQFTLTRKDSTPQKYESRKPALTARIKAHGMFTLSSTAKDAEGNTIAESGTLEFASREEELAAPEIDGVEINIVPDGK